MDTWEFFQDSKGLWRWRCTSADGNLVLNSADAYSRRVQAVANAITRGFVEGGSQTDSDARDDGDADHLAALKRRYVTAFAAYESCLSALSDTWGASNGLREDVANAFHELESARRDYSDALLRAVGAAGSES